MTDTLLGDPASCSQAGGALRRLAAALRATGQPVQEAFTGDEGGRPGRVELTARRRIGTVGTALAASTVALDHVGSALQAHATELADALAAWRHLVTRARAAGLDVVDGTVVHAWGVTGLADSETVATRDAMAVSLQAELDTLSRTVAARREQLGETAADARRTLASHAEALRR